MIRTLRNIAIATDSFDNEILLHVLELVKNNNCTVHENHLFFKEILQLLTCLFNRISNTSNILDHSLVEFVVNSLCVGIFELRRLSVILMDSLSIDNLIQFINDDVIVEVIKMFNENDANIQLCALRIMRSLTQYSNEYFNICCNLGLPDEVESLQYRDCDDEVIKFSRCFIEELYSRMDSDCM